MKRLVQYNFIGSLIVLLFFTTCTKSPSPDILPGTWLEQDGGDSKLIFTNSLLYFYHLPDIDTLAYSLDEKHKLMWIVPLDSSSGGSSHQIEWHKRKEVLMIMGLFPSAFGNKSKNYYTKQ